MLILETPRLLLRPFQDADAEAFAAYRSDPEVARYQGWDAPYSLGQAAAFIAEMQRRQPGQPGEWYQFAIEPKHGACQSAARQSTARLMGDCALHILADDPRQAKIGYTLARVHQGHGYATEAVRRLLDYTFFDLGLHRVTATCDVENTASARLLERIGLRREGHFVDNIWFKGSWGSEYLYAVLQREWTTRREQTQTQ